MGSWQPRAFGQSGGQADAADSAAFAIFAPARSGQVSADHAFDGHDLGLAAKRGPAGQHAAVDLRRQIHLFHVGGDKVVGHAKTVEPKCRNLRQHPPLVRDARGKHPVEGAQPVGAYKQQPVAKIVNVADLAASNGQSGKECFADNCSGHR